MNFDTVAYAVNFVSTQYKATYGQDFTLDGTGTNVIAWNPSKGTAPVPEQIQAGVLLKIKADLISMLNQQAGDVRTSYLADGAYILEEYRLAENEAVEYKGRGFADPVPPMLADYAATLGMTDIQALANVIIAKGNQMRAMLAIVRKIRLQAVAGITVALTADAAATVYETAVATLMTVKKSA